MTRKAFVMKVAPGRHEEYRRRHNPIWTELKEVLKAHGVSNYSIFLHPDTNQLLAYVEAADEDQWAKIADGALRISSCRNASRSGSSKTPPPSFAEAK